MMNVLVIQNTVCEQKENTFSKINNLIKDIDFTKVDIIIFPEMFTTPYQTEYFHSHKESEVSPTLDFLKELSIKTNCYIIGGTIPYNTNEKLYNSCFIVSNKGDIINRYDKIHLFKITYPDGTSFDESNTFEDGKQIVFFDTTFGRIGVMICFDVRFPYLAQKLEELDCKMIVVPAAFNDYTGPKHWTTTFQSRAIDNQLFMIGCSPSSASFGSYQTYGHSIIVNPIGEVIEELDSEESYILCQLDFDEVTKTREVLPIINNKKTI